jgi:hypothetical protein
MDRALIEKPVKRKLIGEGELLKNLRASGNAGFRACDPYPDH